MNRLTGRRVDNNLHVSHGPPTLVELRRSTCTVDISENKNYGANIMSVEAIVALDDVFCRSCYFMRGVTRTLNTRRFN